MVLPSHGLLMYGPHNYQILGSEELNEEISDSICHPEHEAFLEELKNDYDYEYRDNPYPWEAAAHIFTSKDGDIEVIFKQLTDAHLQIHEEPQDTYMIFDWLESKNKRQGNAMEMMSAIIKAADKTGTTLFLDWWLSRLVGTPRRHTLRQIM